MVAGGRPSRLVEVPGRRRAAGALLAVGVAVAIAAASPASPATPATSAKLGRTALVRAAPARAGTWFAYVGGTALSPRACPRTTRSSRECTLAEALVLAPAGGTVALATSGVRRRYVGNWAVDTQRTSSSAPITIRPAPGVVSPTLDGNHGGPRGCGTLACNGPVLTVGREVHLDLDGITIQNADNSVTRYGGAIANDGGGSVAVWHCTFWRNGATDGGAINTFDVRGAGSLTVSASTFSGNTATNGGAINSADYGTATLDVSGSMFFGNTAGAAGGAINNADFNGRGTLSVSGSTFSGNVANTGGAIDNAYYPRQGTLRASIPGTAPTTATAAALEAAAGPTGSNDAFMVVTSSYFSGNSATSGGAVANGVGSIGAGSVSSSTFSGNVADYDGGGIDNADLGGLGTMAVAASTFSANHANNDGGAINNGGAYSKGSLSLLASTFSANSAAGLESGHGGPVIDNGGAVWASADIFNGACTNMGSSWEDEGYSAGSTGSTGTAGSGGACLLAGQGDVNGDAGRLGPLAANGGPTRTMMPLKGNPAIALIPYGATVKIGQVPIRLCPATDQRGVRSGPKQRCNAGAVQFPGPALALRRLSGGPGRPQLQE